MLQACHPQRTNVEATAHHPVVTVISAAEYHPAPGTTASPSEEATCKAWTLDKQQAEQLFALSHELAQGELHDFGWLPCSITGRVEADGRTWDFKINAAGTSIWHSGNQGRMLGCKHAACEPLVIMTPQSAQD